MWQRFTERARKVVFYAQEEAQRFGEGYVSTEHLLLGLVGEQDNVACRIVEKCGVSPDRIREEVENQLPADAAPPSTDMTLSPPAKRVIDLAYHEARNLNNNYIGTEHILLGLIAEADGLAGRVLVRLGVTLELARTYAVELAESGRADTKPESQRVPRARKELADYQSQAVAIFRVIKARGPIGSGLNQAVIKALEQQETTLGKIEAFEPIHLKSLTTDQVAYVEMVVQRERGVNVEILRYDGTAFPESVSFRDLHPEGM